jgi:hypothetical protein
MLKPSFFPITDVNTNALLCPEASLRRTTFNTFFNSSEFILRNTKYTPSNKLFINNTDDFNFSLLGFKSSIDQNNLNTALTLIEPGIEAIKNNVFTFCTKAGDQLIAYKHVDPVLGNYEDLGTNKGDFNETTTKVRGEFNTFIGTELDNIINGEYYNIFQKDYDFTL